MNQYYLDIGNAEGQGTKDGLTPENCMGQNQFAFYNVVPETSTYELVILQEGDYLVKGSWDAVFVIDPSDSFSINNTSIKEVRFSQWGLNPWRWKISTVSNVTPFPVITTAMLISGFSVIKNGIIETSSSEIDLSCSTSIGITNVDIIDSSINITGKNSNASFLIIENNDNGFTDFSINIKGSRIAITSDAASKTVNFSTFAQTISANIVNTVFECPIVLLGNVIFTADYCAFEASPTGGTSTITNSQVNWAPESVLTPSWDAVQADWNIDVINVDIIITGSGSYAGYENDWWGNTRVAVGAGFMFSIPNWVEEPAIDAVTDTTARFDMETDINSTAYFVVVPYGDDQPTSAQVAAGTNAADVPVATGFHGSISLSANVETHCTATNLLGGTMYEAWIVAGSAAGLQAVALEVEFGTKPDWAATYPKVNVLTDISADFLVKTKTNCASYMAVVPHGDPAPNSSQVQAGTDASDTPLAVGFYGSVMCPPNIEELLSAFNLIESDYYDSYFVALSIDTGELQATPVKIELIKPNWVDGTPVIDNSTDVTARYGVETDIDSTVYFVTLPYDDTEPTSAQVKAGTNALDVPVAAGLKGNVALVANVRNHCSASNLSSGTMYQAWIVAESDGILQDFPEVVAFGTTPDWAATYPKLGTIDKNDADFLLEITSTGDGFFVVIPHGDPAPNSEQVQYGTDASDVPVPSGFADFGTLSENIEAILSAHNLVASTTYDVYFVAESAGGAVQPVPVKLEFTTTSLATADFHAVPTLGYVPLSVSFIDDSIGATTWNWNFGDGSTSTLQNPTHIYSVAGIYTVILSINSGASTKTMTNYIMVLAALVSANFHANITSGGIPLTVNFTDDSIGAISWSWNFGDGNTSTLQNPAHLYSSLGIYFVTLSINGGISTSIRVNYINATEISTIANIVVMAQELEQAQNFVDQQNDQYTIMELSSMSMTTARNFIKETNKQNITSSNNWRDNNTGRIVLFEKQGQVNRLM
jgi:PKD repeat protein